MNMEFFLTSMVVILLPGTGVLYTVAYGLGRGFKTSTIAAFGCTLGIVPHAIASIVGLAAILHTSAIAFQGIKLLGVLYLFYMALSIWRDGGALDVSKQKTVRGAGSIIVSGILLNILNPKLSLFFLAFLPQFIPLNAINATSTMLQMAVMFMLLTFLVFVGYGACAALARDYVISRPTVLKWLRRTFAGAFGLLGLKLALSQR